MATGETKIMIGVDEAGRGPVLGPLVVCAVRTEDVSFLTKLGVRDSKVLSPNRREELATEILMKCQVETVIVEANEIDEQRKRITLNEIEVNAFGKAILGLLETELETGGVGDDVAIILDAADVNEERFGQEVGHILREKLGSVPRIISEHKADDKFPVVSAASIIAKVTRDREIDGLRREHGEIGSGYPADPVTKNYLKELFEKGDPIPIFVRQSWETVSRMRTKAATKSLDDFF